MRIGTVRRPPQGVPKSQFASRDFYDTWLPKLAPSASLVRAALKVTTILIWPAVQRCTGLCRIRDNSFDVDSVSND